MKKTFFTILITCILILVLSSSASVTESVSTSAASDTSSFHVQFNLSTIDWTAISSILTAAAIGISIWSNHTAQKAIKTAIDIQRQTAGLSMMQKRVSVISAVKSDNFSAIQESDVLYYFDAHCRNLYNTYKKCYNNMRLLTQKQYDYFQNLKHQYINELDNHTKILDAVRDIERYEHSTIFDPDDKELTFLANQYRLHEPSFTSDGKPTSCDLTYRDVCLNCESAEAAFKESKNYLITALENMLYQSLQPPTV